MWCFIRKRTDSDYMTMNVQRPGDEPVYDVIHRRKSSLQNHDDETDAAAAAADAGDRYVHVKPETDFVEFTVSCWCIS